MKLVTITITAVEMTREEYKKYWNHWRDLSLTIEGKKILDWDDDDGTMLLEGENKRRQVIVRA